MRKIKAITLILKVVGDKCNMNCSYCYEDRSENIFINSEEEILNFLRQFITWDKVFIIFHGGEPLLAKKEVIRTIFEYITINFNNNYNIQIQTNGTLIDDEWIDIFNDYYKNLSISISLDPVGKKDLRVMNSTKNYRDVVYENLKKLSQSKIENIGIISVAHKYNMNFYKAFIDILIKLGIKNLTVNKYRSLDEANDLAYISEVEYNQLLKNITLYLLKEKKYKQIKIQPIVSLISNSKNRLCQYLNDEMKCFYFKTFNNKNNTTNFCNHYCKENVNQEQVNVCKRCDIYNWCGGGCPMEPKNNIFCEGRRNLKIFIEELKNGN